MSASFQLPVQAVEWSCHARTTIKDASGVVIAECNGPASHPADRVAIAAEIVRRVNAHGELVSLARRWAALDAGDWHPVRYASERARLLADTRAAIGAAEGGAE